MTWRLAKALETLRSDINAKWPGRSKASDGTIGDSAHSSRSSDHNAWLKDGNVGVVSALDITHDPARGLDSEQLAEQLRASRDPRIKYIISNKKICSSLEKPWQWRLYTGKNPHNHHVHISVKADKAHYDNTSAWDLDGIAPPRADAPPTNVRPTLKKGDSGEDVKKLQAMLGIDADGEFGPKTEAAVKAAQKQAKLIIDGRVGPQTWAAIA